jgi:galactokinase
MDKVEDLRAKFADRFGTRPASVYRAPGRVNIIGEHTDYTGGFVLPVAIDLSCWAAIGARDDGELVVHSENIGDSAEAKLAPLSARRSGNWSDYPFGVAWALERAGIGLRGANVYVRSEVPIGAGLSSSAALEVAVGFACMDRAGVAVERSKLALLCQRAENEFVGARCGIMDQFVVCHGRAEHALLLDCRSLDFRLVRLPAGVQLVICDTMVKHELGASEYNVRREECEEGSRRLAAALPGVRTLRDVTLPQLEHHRELLGETIYKRCRHVVSENDRVQKNAAALDGGTLGDLAQLMADSHRSLRDDFEVSCEELDLMVELASGQPGVYGARMTGGGFGGCTINLVKAANSAEFQRSIAARYFAAAGLRPNIYVCEASEGVERLAEGRSEEQSEEQSEERK